jgi:hypothetical protein
MARYADAEAKSMSRTNQLLMLVLVSALVALSLPTCMLLGFGMLPSWVAYFIDRSQGRYAFRCVAGINITGVAPYALGLWATDHTLWDAVDLLLDPISLSIMYGTAAIGWMLYLGMPPVVGTFLNVAAQRRIRELKDIQSDLISEWGNGVSTGGYDVPGLADDLELDEDDLEEDEFEDDEEEVLE